MTNETKPIEQDEIHNDDFQFGLKELLSAYQPILEEDLKRATAPEQLKKEAVEKPPSCDDELALANRIFEKFLTEEVAVRLLPAEGRELLGPIERWRWCLLHIRCCIIFGWLVCRGPRTFRAFVYYLYRYWICVRQALGTAVDSPLTAEERQDFQTLVQALASAYKPYLTDQLATVEFPGGIPDEVLAGKIDCFEGEEEAAAIFERLLTVDTAPALLGKAAFEAHSKEPFFWFCRCWCLCAIRFGCCLARARNFIDLLRCLVFYRRCLRECFRPLTCELTDPHDCVEEQEFPAVSLLGVEIVGTATGAGCVSYILEWKSPLDPPAAYSQTGIVYAGSPGPGICGKVNATLGWLDTFSTPVPNEIEIRLRVFGQGNQICEKTTQFQLFKKRVWISAVEGVQVENPPGVFNNAARLIDPVTHNELSFGTALEIFGHALVGKCFGRDIKRYTLSYQAGFVNDPTLGPWTQFWQVDYNSLLQRNAIQTSNFDLTSFWQFNSVCFFPPCPPNFPLVWDDLIPTRWSTNVGGQFFPVDPQLPPIWGSQTLPPINCFSGKYTLRLDVEDTTAIHFYDLQHVWFDNKAIYGEITGLGGVPACAVVGLSQLPNASDCTKVWPLSIDGIAFDEFILEGISTIPSDNYGGYCVTLTKQGGAQSGCSPILFSVALPVPSPTSPTTTGLNRIGEPGVRCATASPPYVGPPLVKSHNSLTVMDGRMFDAVCAGSASPVPPAGFALKRGDCCSFYFVLEVWDKSICPSLSGGRHEASWIWPVYVCNDLK
jgi:hypothetical protein